MLDRKFINREFELKALDERFKSEKPEFFVIYGKRRVGKTELVKQYFKNKRYIYLLCDKRSDSDLLKAFCMQLGEFFDDIGVSMAGFTDWVTFFKYLHAKIGEKRVVIVVDEFPFLVSANKAIPSLFQKGWDEYLQYTNTFFILMGSSISMMERGVLAYKSPLYGRRTGQILLQPLRFKDARKFFPKKNLREQIEFYSVLGGTPAYLLQFTDEKSLFDNIREKMLRKDAFLYNEVEFVLREELKEPRQYFTILKEIAFGRTKINEISQATNLERNVLSRYLSILENLRIIRREIPVTEKHPHKSRKGIYKIEDDFFRFWFEFIFPNRSYIETEQTDFIIQKIKQQLNKFVSYSFEEICNQILWDLLRQKKIPFVFTKIGKWWHKDDEIDIVALNEETKEIMFGECKWQDKKVEKNVVKDLLKKIKLVDWHSGSRKEYCAIFSKTGFEKSCLEICKENGILTFDLKYFERLLNSSCLD